MITLPHLRNIVEGRLLILLNYHLIHPCIAALVVCPPTKYLGVLQLYIRTVIFFGDNHHDSFKVVRKIPVIG